MPWRLHRLSADGKIIVGNDMTAVSRSKNRTQTSCRATGNNHIEFGQRSVSAFGLYQFYIPALARLKIDLSTIRQPIT